MQYKCKVDDSRNLIALLGGLRPRLLAHAKQMLGTGDDAQDAVQDALLVAHSQLNQLKDVTRFPAWIRAIVSSQCYRQLRRRNVVLYGSDIGRLEPVAPRRFDPANAYERKMLLTSVGRAISQLSTPLQETCRLYFEAELPVSEIATILRIQEATVRKRIHGARANLRKILASGIDGPSIVVGYLPISDHLLGMVAHRLSGTGNCRIHMKRFLSWEALAKALRKGTINTAFIMAPLAMQLCNSGIQLKYIMDGHHDGSGITSSTGRAPGKSEDRLHGKRIGVPGTYSTHRILLNQLARECPGSWDNVNTVDTNPSYVINSLKRQAIDAFFCSEPWCTKCVTEGEADMQIHSNEIAPGHICCVVTIREDFCESHPELVSDYVRLLHRAQRKLHSDFEYCAQAQAQYTGVSPDLAFRILEKKIVTFDDLRPDQGRIHEFMQQAISCDVLSRPCDLDAFVCNDFH